MKQPSLLLLLALAAGGVSTTRAQGVRIGLKGGASYSTVVGQNVVGAAYKWGFHGGILLNFKLNDRFSLQPEVLYSQKGTREDNSSTRINLNYVDLPVMLRVAPGIGGLFLEAGPQVGYLAGSDASIDTRKPLRASPPTLPAATRTSMWATPRV